MWRHNAVYARAMLMSQSDSWKTKWNLSRWRQKKAWRDLVTVYENTVLRKLRSNGESLWGYCNLIVFFMRVHFIKLDAKNLMFFLLRHWQKEIVLKNNSFYKAHVHLKRRNTEDFSRSLTYFNNNKKVNCSHCNELHKSWNRCVELSTMIMNGCCFFLEQ